MVLDDVEPSEFARWLGNVVYESAKKSGPPLVLAGAKRARDYFRPSFRDYAYSGGKTKFVKQRVLTNSTMNATNTTKAGGVRAPSRVNAKNGSWVKWSAKGKDANIVATRGWVKKTLALDNVRKEVTTNTTSLTSAAPPVFFRLGKNVDKGIDQGDRLSSKTHLLGFRLFGSLTKFGPVPPLRVRFLIMQDKTPMRTTTEAFYSTVGDSREPVDFPLTPTSMDSINAIRPINTDRWIVLKDWVEFLNPDGSVGSGHPCTLLFNRYFKMNKKFTYNPGYNTETTDLTPTIYLVYYQLSDAGDITSTSTVNFQFEEYFT